MLLGHSVRTAAQDGRRYSHGTAPLLSAGGMKRTYTAEACPIRSTANYRSSNVILDQQPATWPRSPQSAGLRPTPYRLRASQLAVSGTRGLGFRAGSFQQDQVDNLCRPGPSICPFFRNFLTTESSELHGTRSPGGEPADRCFSPNACLLLAMQHPAYVGRPAWADTLSALMSADLNSCDDPGNPRRADRAASVMRHFADHRFTQTGDNLLDLLCHGNQIGRPPINREPAAHTAGPEAARSVERVGTTASDLSQLRSSPVTSAVPAVRALSLA